MLDVSTHAPKSVREAVKLSGGLAALFLVGALYCIHWLSSHGAFGKTTVDYPINLQNGSSIIVHFSVPYRADYDIGIWYKRNASDDGEKNVRQIVGRMTLRTDGSLVEQKALPVDHGRSDRDGSAMVLFTGPMEPRNDYSLSLEVDRVPPALVRSQGVVRIELEHLYPLIFWQVEFAVLCSVLISLFCLLMSVRWRRATTRAEKATECVR
jgi:hypothetical protein